jgi:hypothetical protein
MANDVATIDNFLRKHGYRFDNLENFIYKMAFLENEDFVLAVHRTTYLALVSLKHLGWTTEEEEDHTLSYAIGWICDFFSPYTKETECLMYYTSKTKEEEDVERIQNYRLEKYLGEYRYYLDVWSGIKLDKYSELFDDKFALIRNGKFKHHLIVGKRDSDYSMSLHIWTDDIFTKEERYEFTFKNDKELEEFLLENKVVIDSCLSNDFFLDEKSYISAFREQFDNQDLFEHTLFFNPFIETLEKRTEDWKRERKELG